MSEVLASNALVRLVVDDSEPAGVPTRVDHVAADRTVVVAAPAFGGDLFVTTGRPVTIVWADVRGMYELPSVLTEVVHARVPLWHLTPRGEPQLLQRRRFVRVRCQERLLVQPRPGGVGGVGSVGSIAGASAGAAGGASAGAVTAGGEPEPAEAGAEPTVLTGVAVDLSEGGVRTLLPATESPLQPGASVTVELSLGARTVVPSGTVLRSIMGEKGQLEVVIRFDDPVDGEEHIRRWVMQQQLLERRTARDA
ncbi:MAG: PilZ domain-containing protein [Actinomycetes bacterium]